MSNVLNKICADKRDHVAAQKAKTPLAALKAKIADLPPQLTRFNAAIQNCPHTAIIAEVKKASPSKGILREDFDPANIARIYQENGATCISVLTDTPYFQGQDSYLKTVKSVCDLPVLRKDFMIDAYQIYESKALGADCILLIIAALDDHQAAEYYDLANTLDMDVLVEVHDKEELERALEFSPAMIGVNNRNLKTLKVDVQTSLDLLPYMPPEIIRIAESGLQTKETLNQLEKAGYNGFLIGETFMKSEKIGENVKALSGA